MKAKIMINLNSLKYCTAILTLFLMGCASEKPLQIQVTNNLDINRSFETVEIDLIF